MTSPSLAKEFAVELIAITTPFFSLIRAQRAPREAAITASLSAPVISLQTPTGSEAQSRSRHE